MPGGYGADHYADAATGVIVDVLINSDEDAACLFFWADL